jgi:hypothetical protein
MRVNLSLFAGRWNITFVERSRTLYTWGAVYTSVYTGLASVPGRIKQYVILIIYAANHYSTKTFTRHGTPFSLYTPACPLHSCSVHSHRSSLSHTQQRKPANPPPPPPGGAGGGGKAKIRGTVQQITLLDVAHVHL